MPVSYTHLDVYKRQVHVPADDDRFVPVERADELAERIVPVHPVFQPAQAVLGVRRDVYKRQSLNIP